MRFFTISSQVSQEAVFAAVVAKTKKKLALKAKALNESMEAKAIESMDME